MKMQPMTFEEILAADDLMVMFGYACKGAE